MFVRTNFIHVYSMELVLTTVTKIDVADQASPDTPPILLYVSPGLHPVTLFYSLTTQLTWHPGLAALQGAA